MLHKHVSQYGTTRRQTNEMFMLLMFIDSFLRLIDFFFFFLSHLVFELRSVVLQAFFAHQMSCNSSSRHDKCCQTPCCTSHRAVSRQIVQRDCVSFSRKILSLKIWGRLFIYFLLQVCDATWSENQSEVLKKRKMCRMYSILFFYH